MDPNSLAQRVVHRERPAIGQALSLVEDRRPGSSASILALLKALMRVGQGRLTPRIGFTGPPGVGKSTLVAAVARELRRRRKAVGVLAVDPTSPRSGGALLADRARIDPGHGDDSIFVRSMASGGDLGGLARAALSAVDVLAASHDVVLIETVGVGQSETDVEFVSDATVLVLQPASGDTLQFLKAGILEIPDVFVVNKLDLGQVAERTRRDLLSSLKSVRAAGLAERSPEVIGTSCSSGLGIAHLVDVLDALRASLESSGQLSLRRQRGIIAWSERLLMRRVGELGIEAIGGKRAVRDAIEHQVRAGRHGLEVVQDLSAEAIRALRAQPYT